MSDRTWNDGPPPHAGWWSTSVTFYDDAPGERWGWWDGRFWSVFADPNDSAKLAAKRAGKRGGFSGSTAHVQWCDYWPLGARVPRINPSRGQGGSHG